MMRRDFVKAAAMAAAAAPVVRLGVGTAEAAQGAPAADPWRGLKVGVASYTLRKLPLEQAITAIQRVGLRYVSIKDFHLALTSTAEERRAVARRFQEAGITPLSCGNISMQNDAANIRQAFEYARDTGLPTIVCSPHPDSMPILDAMVKEFDIKLAIHNHGPEDKRFPSPYDVWKAVEKYRARLYDLHFKDIASTAPDGKTIEAGRGVLDLPAILRAILDVKYPHLVSFEYEKDENDPLPGLSETVGYTKGLLARMA